MIRYLITHSLLSAWQYAMRDSRYENEERDPFDEFLRVLRREPTQDTPQMRSGREFEELVTAIATDREYDTEHPWAAAAQTCAFVVRGGSVQYRAKAELMVDGIPILLYGRLDYLRAGSVIDTKFTTNYERGKYFDSTQHPVYLRLIPEAYNFVYLISNGHDVFTETYSREETPPVEPVISDFLRSLRTFGLWELFAKHWATM